MNLENYWIMEEEYIPFHTTPVKFVISNPQIFDIDVEEIQGSYRRHQEGLGNRGVAWWWVSLELFRSGWILASHQSPKDGDTWLFEFSTLEEALYPIIGFFRRYYAEWLFPPTSPLELHGMDDFSFKFYPRSEGGVSALLGEYIQVTSE